MSDDMTPERGRRRLLTFLLVLVLAGVGTFGYLKYVVGRSGGTPGVNDVSRGDAQQEATLVNQEDQRIMQLRAAQDSALQKGGPQAAQMRQPHFASSANGRTLVLPQRSAPYYVADLERYGQQDFEKQPDGTYLLGVNVFVAEGAKLVLQNATGPLTIRMASAPGSFTSIVSFGGSMRINGSAQNPVRITSWNERSRQPDTQVADGRAYLRAIGGEFRMTYSQVTDLGFWSGRTGGIALTGTDRPDQSAAPLPGWNPPATRLRMPDGRADRTRGGQDEIEVSPAGRAASGSGFLVPAANLVTGSIEDSTISGNAYGIFVSASNQTRIFGNRIDGSLVDGVLMHRFARNADIEDTTVTASRGDGFVLSRATDSVRITGCTSERNGGNGFTLNGQPLANGPSASGESLRAFGNSSLSSSTARDNGHYGVELLGGTNLAVQTSKIIGGDMGIVVRDKASGVQISGNQLLHQHRQGIVLRDGAVGTKVAGNIVNDTKIAFYLRDSSATFTGNTVQSASLHGVTVVGQANASQIIGNTFSGTGLSVLDQSRARGPVRVGGNNATAWHDTAGLWTEIRRFAKPMNIIWAAVLTLVGVSALRSRGSGLRIGRHAVPPYPQRVLERRPVRPLRPPVLEGGRPGSDGKVLAGGPPLGRQTVAGGDR